MGDQRMNQNSVNNSVQPARKIFVQEDLMKGDERSLHSGAVLNTQILASPAAMKAEFESLLADWRSQQNIGRLWNGDAKLWSNKDERDWLGWLQLPKEEILKIQELQEFTADVQADGFTDVLVMGMGGSSLCPVVMSETFAARPGFLKLHVLDSTQPDQLQIITAQLDLPKTLFIVSSKSGSTLEPNIFCDYFFAKVRNLAAGDKEFTGNQFIAITDPGSALETKAKDLNFRKVFAGKRTVGGRYSALSNFGLVPMTLMGIDIEELLCGAQRMAETCAPNADVEKNSALQLGLLLGLAAKRGHDKVTFFCSRPIFGFQTWLEQLLAESTGKQGKGLIPIAGEAIAPVCGYGRDRVFVHLHVEGERDEELEMTLSRLEKDEHPVVRISMEDKMGIGQEFFRWEFATAVAGAVLGINPFDQPDVEASKEATRKLVSAFEDVGALKSSCPVLSEASLDIFVPDRSQLTGSSMADIVRSFLGSIKSGDYFAILAYLPINKTVTGRLEKLRSAVGGGGKTATCLEFGPRFLHSTGQVYKGGPNTGIFLELTCDAVVDVAIPSRHATFGIIALAEAIGDFQVLSEEKHRRALRIHIHGDLDSGLLKLNAAFNEFVSFEGGI
jgi:transaldolase/glucose-6-phosphate isomerase